MREWISVNDRLPEKNDYYLTFSRVYTYDVLYYSTNEKEWVDLDEDYYYQNGWVTYWMPLPEPPESED